MSTVHIGRPEGRLRRWLRVADGTVDGDEAVDERSMRVLEVGFAGIILGMVALLSFAQAPAGPSLGVVEILGLGGVLFVGALVALIR